jgi:hypothetical protein
MNQNDINYASQILKHLKIYVDEDNTPYRPMVKLIEEATAWIDTAKEALSNQDVSNLAASDAATEEPTMNDIHQALKETTEYVATRTAEIFEHSKETK